MTTVDPRPRLDDDADLDGGATVLLAPVRGADIRRSLPEDLFVKQPHAFTAKFAFAVVMVAACWVAVALVRQWWVAVPAIAALGLLYAHLVELQHECLHEHAYRRRRLNRLVGFVCGIPMLSSYSHYKYEHLRHHAYLGTPQNQEFFNYRFEGLGSVPGFLRACFHLGRYLDVLANIGRALTGHRIPRVAKPSAERKTRTEYLGFAAVLATAAAATAVTGSPYLVLVWVVPALLVAEPAHFLVELPEHFGLDTQSDPNVLTNTRTVHGGRVAKWFTNGNDLHTAHHFHQGVPMAQVPRLHTIIADRVATVEPSYWSFYRNVVRGRVRYADPRQTCMTR